MPLSDFILNLISNSNPLLFNKGLKYHLCSLCILYQKSKIYFLSLIFCPFFRAIKARLTVNTFITQVGQLANSNHIKIVSEFHKTAFCVGCEMVGLYKQTGYQGTWQVLLPGQQSTGETLVNDNKCDNSVRAFKSLATSVWQRPSKDYRLMSTCPSLLLNKTHLIVHFRYNLSFVIKGLIWGFIYFLVGIPFCILGSQLLSPYSVGYIFQELVFYDRIPQEIKHIV